MQSTAVYIIVAMGKVYKFAAEDHEIDSFNLACLKVSKITPDDQEGEIVAEFTAPWAWRLSTESATNGRVELES